jgi:5'-nucleotidase
MREYGPDAYWRKHSNVILLVNDDGVEHPGLRALHRALRARLKQPVLAVVPAQQRSGMSHAITLDRALPVTTRHDDDFFAFVVDGTPTDCVKLGLTTIIPERPSLVVSGINDGSNCGRSLFYSGTVGAALEAAIEGHIALAVNRDHGSGGFTAAANLASEVASWLVARPEYRGKVVNLNIPAGEPDRWQPLAITGHGHSGFRETYKPVRENRDQLGWRLHGDWVAAPDDGESDAHLLTRGHPVLTLLRPDLNDDQESLRRLVQRRTQKDSR